MKGLTTTLTVFASLSFSARAAASDMTPRYISNPLSSIADTVERRQSGGVCDISDKECGTGCIPSSYVCCEDDEGAGCPPGDECFIDSFGTPGCCPEGSSCGRGGGISTEPSFGPLPTFPPLVGDDGDDDFGSDSGSGGSSQISFTDSSQPTITGAGAPSSSDESGGFGSTSNDTNGDTGGSGAGTVRVGCLGLVVGLAGAAFMA